MSHYSKFNQTNKSQTLALSLKSTSSQKHSAPFESLSQLSPMLKVTKDMIHNLLLYIATITSKENHTKGWNGIWGFHQKQFNPYRKNLIQFISKCLAYKQNHDNVTLTLSIVVLTMHVRHTCSYYFIMHLSLFLPFFFLSFQNFWWNPFTPGTHWRWKLKVHGQKRKVQTLTKGSPWQ